MADIAEAELRTLIHKRGAVKARVTRFTTYLATVDNDNELTQVKLRLDKFKSTWDEFEIVQTNLEQVDPNNAAQHEQERVTFENTYFAAMAQAENIIKRSEPAAVLPLARRDNLPENPAQVKLPTINLPTFSGAYDQWMAFLDTFQSLIHDNANISPIQKFHYLRSALTDDAAQVIHSLEISAASYDIAWELLKERFDNKRIIIQNHVKALFDLPAVTRESHQSLRQLLDATSRHLRALKSLEQPIESWDTMLVHLITSKFDHSTKREWESITDAKKLPTWTDLNKFLQHRCHLLQSLIITTPQISIKPPIHKQQSGWSRHNDKHAEGKKRDFLQSHMSTNKPTCPKCEQAHLIYHCPAFNALPASDRVKEVKRLHLCINCMRTGHQASQCNSGSCRICARKHNTMLHFNSMETPVTSSDNVSQNTSLHVSSVKQPIPNQTGVIIRTSLDISSECMQVPELGISNPGSTSPFVSSRNMQFLGHATADQHILKPVEDRFVVLSTARLVVFDNHGQPHECRALLDSGSQSSFMSKDLAQRLRLDLYPTHIPVSGISQSVTPVSHFAKAKIKSRLNNYQADLSFLILTAITEKLPALRLDRKLLCIPSNLKLADPGFDKPAPIDMLIGAELFWDLLCIGQVKSAINQAILQKTQFGWIVSGCINQHQQQLALSPAPCFLAVQPELQQQMQKFWVLEETPPVKYFSTEESSCESHFIANTKRDADGRFIVRLPLRSEAINLGNSRATALKRFNHLERKWMANTSFRQEYIAVLKDYLSEGHMQQVPESELDSDLHPVYYLPHHAVLKEQSTTTKLRVVFDGSAPSTNGTSLNDLLMVGPTIQDDLLSIIIRFRIHRHVMTADIVKMYRQIKVHETDSDLQRILWRPNPEGPIGTYRLNTVTFGTACAPFLATRCLVQTANEEIDTSPGTSSIIKRDFYVDDLLTGADTRAELTLLKSEISQILAKSGFHLHKWNSTCPELRDESRESTNIQLTNQDPVKTLGIYWDSTSDRFSYRHELKVMNSGCTKRRILTIIAGIFDPLGLIGPIIVIAKMLMQELWQLKTGWDEAVSQDVFTQWQAFERGLPLLNELYISRCVISLATPSEVHIHGFCDASEKAYGACIYVCCTDHHGSYTSHLLCARSRVAPLKTISIPRLELCSAVLLARITRKVMTSLNLKPHSITLWSDSTVALTWISSSPHRLKTFVANRVSEIQTITADSTWFHVSSQDNPADLLSRGCTALQLIQGNSLWWNGPTWLSMDPQQWPTRAPLQECTADTPELRVQITSLVAVSTRSEIFQRFSSLTRLVNVVAYCLRFKHNCKSPKDKKTGALLPGDRNQSLNHLLHLAQLEFFPKEIRQLSSQAQVASTSRLLSLSPFLDGIGIVRVGGRLQKAILSEDQKHPIILPPHHPLTRLIIKDEHENHLHAGALGTLSAVRQRYWPLTGRRTVQGIIRTCITCFRVKPPLQTPTMGQLPASRITPSRPFSICGVDFAGPFLLRQGGPRSKSKVKSYLAVFVCFATRATHLELVSALSSDAFLATLKRFIGRRGKPNRIYSDNGTNFTGANNELRLMRKHFYAEECQDRLISWLADKNIQWSFIPPASPHFGGIWEAAVKSAKRHLLPVMGNALLTFEELTTLLVQVESCLNSRPISPLSSDPNDLAVLTPGHFLIGSALTAIEEPSLQDVSMNRLSRWQRVQQIAQHFWSRWSREYLSQLQQRQKWSKTTPPLTIGTLVLIRDDRTPPLKWPLGRITQVHPGQDGVVRVATVRTLAGSFKRAVSKLCVLPLETTPVTC